MTRVFVASNSLVPRDAVAAIARESGYGLADPIDVHHVDISRDVVCWLGDHEGCPTDPAVCVCSSVPGMHVVDASWPTGEVPRSSDPGATLRFLLAALRPHRGPEVAITSFGWRWGEPGRSDWIIDARCLPNPFWTDLKTRDGTDEEVVRFVLADSEDFVAAIASTLSIALTSACSRGTRRVSVGVGCTGGLHRSVALADEVGRRLSPIAHAYGCLVRVEHRDLAQARVRLGLAVPRD